MTAKEFFETVDKKVREKGMLMADLLEYGLGTDDEEITSDDCHTTFLVDFGGSEGIYLDLFLNIYDKREPVRFGTYKTLETSKEVYDGMCLLGADCVFAADELIRSGILGSGGAR